MQTARLPVQPDQTFPRPSTSALLFEGNAAYASACGEGARIEDGLDRGNLSAFHLIPGAKERGNFFRDEVVEQAHVIAIDKDFLDVVAAALLLHHLEKVVGTAESLAPGPFDENSLVQVVLRGSEITAVHCGNVRRDNLSSSGLHVSPLRPNLATTHSSLRPSIDFSIVISSAYSISLPSGMPIAIRVTFTPARRSCPDK